MKYVCEDKVESPIDTMALISLMSQPNLYNCTILSTLSIIFCHFTFSFLKISRTNKNNVF